MFKRFLSCAAVVTVLLVLAACGSAPGEPSAQPEASGQAEPASAEPAGKAGDETRLVSHAMGETEVPAKPQRVVVLDMGELDMALSLGVQPVGAAFYRADQPLPSYLADKVQGEIERVGTVSQPNLEAIAALEPDLILSNKLRHEDIYDELSQIAPTVFAESLGAAWKEQFAVVAEALGKTEEHAQIMQAYQDAIKAFQQKMGDQLQHTEVSLVRSFPDHVRLYLKQSFSGTIIADAGLPRPPAQDKDEFALQLQAPAEHIPEMDGDVIFLFYYNREQGEMISDLKKNPLWQQLRAVQAGRVYEVDDEVWGTGLGPTAAQLVVADLVKYLTP